MRNLAKTLFASAVVVTCGIVPSFGAITVNGSLSGGEPDFGKALTTQTDYTGFGKNTTDNSGESTGGSELDAAYGTIENGTLYLLLTGNIEGNTTANHLNVYIADGRTGQSTLAAPAGSTLAANNGSKFSSNFGNGATFVIDTNVYSGTAYTDAYDLIGGTSAYLGSTDPLGAAELVSSGQNAPYNGIGLALNNSNTAGEPPTSPADGSVTAAQAQTATTGLELAIPLSDLGNATGNIEVLALVNGSADGYVSNQLLPGLAAGTANEGPTFDFSGTPGEFFTVAVPEPASFGLLAGIAGLAIRRRRNA